MAAMLAIVKSAAEAVAAARAGADRAAIASWTGAIDPGAPAGLVDLPEYRIGALITAGPEEAPVGRVEQAVAAGLTSLYLPLGEPWRDLGRRARAAGLLVIGVIGPGPALDEALCDEAAVQGLAELLVGEAPFTGRRLLDGRSIGTLSSFVADCRARGIGVTLAGALEMPDIPRLLALGPDRLGFDLALRDGQGRFDRARVAEARAVMSQSASEPSPSPPGSDQADRIFVRDWTVRMSIGAYARERGEAQRVRFSIEAEVLRPKARSVGMADVVSYDLIIDAIARLTSGHVDLVETLADNIASAVLAHPRVASVDVTVEKLDVGPGSVGCRIARRR